MAVSEAATRFFSKWDLWKLCIQISRVATMLSHYCLLKVLIFQKFSILFSWILINPLDYWLNWTKHHIFCSGFENLTSKEYLEMWKHPCKVRLKISRTHLLDRNPSSQNKYRKPLHCLPNLGTQILKITSLFSDYSFV